MNPTYWHKQTADQPLFPKLQWSRPETKSQAGKLAIVGGNVHGFSAPAEAYNQSQRAGIGVARVLLPLPVQKLLPKGILEADFAPSTPSGSFARKGLAELLDLASWADGTLLAGEFGRNSETAILLEQFLQKHRGQVTLTKDSVAYFLTSPATMLQRPDTTAVLNFGQLQKLASSAHFASAFTSDMGLVQFVEALHDFTSQHQLHILARHHETFVVAVNGQVSTTPLPKQPKLWCAAAAAHASVWWLQNPAKPFEALTTSLLTT
jgi:hypothetical protein